MKIEFEEAKRTPIDIRMDLIPPEILLEISKVFALGAKKYGDYNWQKSRMVGGDSPINHALKHILNYGAGIQDEDGEGDLKVHLTHAIVNLIFEYWWEAREENTTTSGELVFLNDKGKYCYEDGSEISQTNVQDVTSTKEDIWFLVTELECKPSSKNQYMEMRQMFSYRGIPFPYTIEYHKNHCYYYSTVDTDSIQRCKDVIKRHFLDENE